MTRRLALAALLAATAPVATFAQTPPAPETSKPAPFATVTPYGFIHVGYYDNLGPYTNKDYPGEAQARSAGVGGSDLISARASRFGFKVALTDEVWGAKVSGVIEADFKGGQLPSVFDTTTTTTTTSTGSGASIKYTSTSASKTSASAPSSSWYNALLRIRHANLKAAWKTDYGDVAFVGGQDWALVAPLSPATLVYAADQLFTGAGNLNRRAPQLKLTYDRSLDAIGINAAVAVLSPADKDGSDTGILAEAADYGFGNRSRLPDFEGRIGISGKVDGKKVAEVGVAAHVNKRRYVTASNANNDVTESVFGLDAQVNLPYLTLQGEAFTGQAIDDAYLGIAPGVNTAHNNGAVLTQGFWAQAVVKPIPLVDLIYGYGIEQPKIADLSGVSARTRNTMFGGGVIVNANKAWHVGLESYRTISFKQDAKGVATRAEAVQLALASKLDF